VGLSEGEYVAVRARAFEETIKKAGRSCVVFSPMGREAKATDLVSLKKWLEKCTRLCSRISWPFWFWDDLNLGW
jgi:hypothetical protein